MSKNSSNRNEAAPATTAVPPGMFVSGIAFLLAAIACTLLLVISHFGGINLPGCRVGGACAEAAASVWGKVPRTAWPISFVGLAYFLGLLIAWLGSRDGVSAPLRLLVRIGVLLSVLYVIVLIVEKHLCYYCLATHAANFAFWIVVERCRHSRISLWRPVATAAVVFLLASAALGAMRERETKAVQVKQEAELADSTKEIIRASAADHPAQHQTTATTAPGGADPAALDRPWTGGFTGRYRLGPEKAPIRIVLLTDYQCPDCYRTEKDLKSLLLRRKDVSVSIKHFPFCVDCNPTIATESNMHPNACWAARAAETAGILRGNDGFWKMHEWLFEHRGSFTNDQFTAGLQELGYSPDEISQFNTTMTSQLTLDLVKSDVLQGIWLGLHYTPMVFINGVELKGVFADDALSRAVDELARTNPPARNADHDQPPPAIEKYLTDWSQGEFKFAGQDSHPWPMGPEGAKVQVVLWGDYQEPFSAAADAEVRRLLAGRKDAQYVFRHYPVNQGCNSSAGLTKHPLACRAHQAAEAAGLLGGVDGYWKMHEWLFAHQKDFSEETLRAAVEKMGFLPDAFFVAMNSPEVSANISEDCRYGKSLGLYSIPFIFVNGKHVPRWQKNGKYILDQIIAEATKETAAKK